MHAIFSNCFCVGYSISIAYDRAWAGFTHRPK